MFFQYNNNELSEREISKSIIFKIKYYCCFSVAQWCLNFCNPMDCSMPGFPVLHYLPELAQTHVH